MNQLHFEYLRETGKQAKEDLKILNCLDEESIDNTYRSLRDLEENKELYDYPTLDYIAWLEDKLNNLNK